MENEKMKEKARREFLIKAGKLAVYTPPAIMLLMHPSKATACTSAGGKKPLGGFPPRGDFKPQGDFKPHGDFKFGGDRR